MTCASCGTENPAGARFCMSCGAALERRCPSCGTPAPPEARFCMTCGSALDAEAGTVAPRGPAGAAAPFPPARGPEAVSIPPEERRQVTVLFADLSGYTAFAERMDPETVKSLVDRALLRLGHEVERYGGTVDKYIGDNVMALFGAPVAHEDDAERAVRAGLGMQAAMAEINDGLPEGVHFALRVGVNSGEVLAGAIGDAYTVTGDTVNVASRLQSCARPGSVTVGERTMRATDAAVEYEALEPLDLKGKAERVPAWEAVGLIAEHSVRRVSPASESPLVGRRQELDAIEHLAQWVRAPLMLVCLARDELLDRRPSWGGGRRSATQLMLGPLSDEHSRALVRALLPQGQEVVPAVAERSGGNPLFAEEMARRIAEEGTIEAAELPDTVQAVLAARLDSLEPFERRLVQQAAVVGRTFPDEARAEGVRIGEKLGDVSLRLGRVDEAIGVWSDCLEWHRGQEDLERVADLHRKIGAALSHKGERKAAIEHYQKGINLLKDGPPRLELVRLYEEAAWLYLHTGDNMLAIYASEKALRLAERLGETRAASRAHGIFGRVFGRIGDTEKARQNLERAVELARAPRDNGGSMREDQSETILALSALGR